MPLVFEGQDEPSGAFELYLPYAPVQAAIDDESRQLYLLLALGTLSTPRCSRSWSSLTGGASA